MALNTLLIRAGERYKISKRAHRWLEFALIFCGLPVVAIAVGHLTQGLIIPLLLVLSLYCICTLWRDPKFKRKRLGKMRDLAKHSKHLHLGFTAWSVWVVLLVWWFLPQLFLSLPTEQPYAWLSTLFIYPFLSVIPQELIFRTFFFHRYKKLFPNKILRVVVSAVCFALAHGFYGNWVAVVVAGLGGLLFGLSYVLTKSTLVVVVQHSAWGLLLLTVGIGNYFNSQLMA